MTTPADAHAAFHAQKSGRRARQKEAWEGVLRLPAEERPAALFAAWPQKLPRWLIPRLSPELRQERQALREQAANARMQDYLDMLGSQMSLDAVVRQSLAEHTLAIQEACAVIDGLPGLRRLSFSIASPQGVEWVVKEELAAEQKASESSVLPAVALAIAMGGGLTIRQDTALRVLAPDPRTGEPSWRPQQRVYGMALGDGGWMALGDKEMRSAHTTNAATGQPLPAEPGLIYADLKAVAKRCVRPRA